MAVTYEDHERRYKKRLVKWKDKKSKAEQQAEDSVHLHIGNEVLGRITKDGNYRKNCFFYILGDSDRKNIYDKAIKAEHKFKYQDSSTKKHNFFNQSNPYKVEAHHILPKNCFTTETGDSKPGFTDEQLELLIRVPWDLNHGENLIYLPKSEDFCLIHNLPEHNGYHGQYVKLVVGDIKSIQAHLKSDSREPCEPEEFPQLKILKMLISFQKKYWNMLVNRGAGKIEAHSRAELDGQSAGANSGV